jgi:predicted ATP-grasp superfamily ATP-dependent carboligase
MILLKITNASDVVASKAGKLFEKMTPEMIDQKLVESQVIQQMIDQLQLEGLKGVDL